MVIGKGGLEAVASKERKLMACELFLISSRGNKLRNYSICAEF
jgi:hypothetical protein